MNAWLSSYMDAWNSHDGAKVADFMAEDVTYEVLGTSRVYRGREGVIGYVNDTNAGSGDYQFVHVDGLVEGNSFTWEWEMLGTHTGPPAGIPATNRKIRLRGVSIGHFDDEGKIKENRDYFNLADFLVQVGILPTPS
jgi:steroid delta-isomerase-like uncharacterized protein